MKLPMPGNIEVEAPNVVARVAGLQVELYVRGHVLDQSWRVSVDQFGLTDRDFVTCKEHELSLGRIQPYWAISTFLNPYYSMSICSMKVDHMFA